MESGGPLIRAAAAKWGPLDGPPRWLAQREMTLLLASVMPLPVTRYRYTPLSSRPFVAAPASYPFFAPG